MLILDCCGSDIRAPNEACARTALRDYEENLAIRRACDRPLVLDETIDGADVLLRAIADGLVDGITIKLARVGGITKAKLLRDIAVACNLKITIEDTGGAEIDTAAYCGLMLSTPEGLRQHTVDFYNWVTVSNASTQFAIADGKRRRPPGWAWASRWTGRFWPAHICLLRVTPDS